MLRPLIIRFGNGITQLIVKNDSVKKLNYFFDKNIDLQKVRDIMRIEFNENVE